MAFLTQDNPRLTVIGIDGVPKTLLLHMIESGVMPALKALTASGTILEQKSVLPTVSSAAWTSFMTGLLPPRHRIMGFLNKDEGAYRVTFPRTSDIRGKLIQEVVSERGGKVFSMGVPVTSPPMQINGVVISCFLSPGLDKAVWPPQELQVLKELHYVIDPDPTVAHKDKAQFMHLVLESLARRIDTVRHYFRRENWALFLAHVMETDRLHHFFWDDFEDPSARFHTDFYEFYRMLDSFFDWLGNELQGADGLVILSDHGFCKLDYEVNLGKWLVDQGWTRLEHTRPGPPLSNIRWHDTRVYSLIPGRIYLNLAGREELGAVSPSAKEAVFTSLREALQAWRSPDGKQVVKAVLIEREIPGYERGIGVPDMLLVPNDGMDLKDGMLRPQVFERRVLNGMHTYDNATLFLGAAGDHEIHDAWIGDLTPTLLELLDLPIPLGLDGRSLLSNPSS